MKFIHLADLHIGKRVNAFPMLEDQRYILKQILTILREERPDGGVILAGDIYDKAIPSAEAVELFDEFLTQLAALRLRVFIIAGNHDSPERIAFGNRLMDRSGIYLSPVYDGHVKRITCPDRAASVTLSAANAVDLNAGTHSVESASTSAAASTCPPVDVYLLPFLKPANVRRFYPEETIESYTDAMRVAIAHMDIDPTHRNLLVTHQFVTGASRSDSEDISVGGSDNVDASVFAPFDYVALGHLHGPQQMGEEGGPLIRYAGTPLKYSFSEARHHKSVTVVEIGEKKADGVVDVCISTRELRPLHDMREIRGSYEELTLRANYEGTATDDYIHATLTDEIEIPDAARHLQVIYPNLMKLDYDNARTRGQGSERLELEQLEEKSPLDLFSELFEKQNHKEMTEEQARYVQAQMEKIWEA
ncbi:exonuclease SbcCD subunit D [Oribacterium sp. HCP3S3_B9]|uniref:exonuclease SbcCD subunit D n=1 Tax=Oribacterium sp. HCP3S3_B9 TaxID=3438946 RepID=UPI003F8AB360